VALRVNRASGLLGTEKVMASTIVGFARNLARLISSGDHAYDSLLNKWGGFSETHLFQSLD